MGWSDPQAREKLRELVAQVLEEVESKGSGAVESACERHPELADALRQRIETLRRMGLVGTDGGERVGGLSPLGSRGGEEPIPERLGDFKLLERLGGGGMGVVYLAEQESLKRKVALKLVRPELLFFGGARDRFRREVEAVARLNHPGIVPVYFVDAAADVPHFAMEWIEGGSLDDVMRALKGREPAQLAGADLATALGAQSPESNDGLRELTAGRWVDVCFRLVRQAAVALQHAHERGVIHRDLKPSNLMLTRDGRVRLVDFGLASTEGTSKITRSSSQIGSLPYTAPEQLLHGVAAVDAKSDVYALGVVLYELLTLRPAYSDEDPEATRRRIIEGQHAPLRSLAPQIAWDAETVCLTAMERDPARRYASASDFAQDLKRVLDFEPIAARRASAALRIRRFAQRRPTLAVGALLGALLVIGGPLTWAFQEHRYGEQLTEKNQALAATNVDLSDANRDLSAAKQKIEEQLVAEKLARDAANRSAARAREAILEFLGRVGDELLINVPGAENLRRDLLQRATVQLEAISRDSDADSTSKLQMANAYRLLGTRHAELGDDAKANAAFSRGLELVSDVETADPARVEWQRKRADLLAERAMTTFDLTRDFEGALADAEQAIALYRGLIVRPEFTAWARTALGSTLNVRAQALSSLGRFDESLPLYEEAVNLLEEAVRLDVRSEEARRYLLSARNNHAAVLERADRLEEAEAVYLALLADVVPELERAPGDAWRRFVVAAASSNLGMVLDRLERQEEAEPAFRESIAAYERLAQDFPARPVYRRELARTLEYLAASLDTIRGDEHDGDEEDEEIGRVLERASTLLEPQCVPSVPFDGIAHLALANVQRRLGERAAAEGSRELARSRLTRAASLAAILVARDGKAYEVRKLESRVARAWATAPDEIVPRDERVDHAWKAFAAAAESVRCCRPGQLEPSARDELFATFELLPSLTDGDDADVRIADAARQMLELLPSDAEAARRAQKATGSAGAGG